MLVVLVNIIIIKQTWLAQSTTVNIIYPEALLVVSRSQSTRDLRTWLYNAIYSNPKNLEKYIATQKKTIENHRNIEHLGKKRRFSHWSSIIIFTDLVELVVHGCRKHPKEWNTCPVHGKRPTLAEIPHLIPIITEII